MDLFDSINRVDAGPSGYAESDFSFMNRSARPAVARVRHLLENWFARYPTEEQAELCARFRSHDRPHHRSAFFELFLHELLLRLGCSVQVHPGLENESKSPDFLVSSSNGERFYVEAVLATDESAEDAAANARKSVVYDTLNRLESRDFFVGMNLKGAPATPPSGSSIRAFLGRHLSKLDADEITLLWKTEGIESVPHWDYHHEGWDIEFFPIPKSPEARGKPGARPIGVYFHGFRMLDSSKVIREAILKKAGRYGELGLPYIIAANIFCSFAVIDKNDVLEALLGKSRGRVNRTKSGVEIQWLPRVPDGAWEKYSRVSAALVATPISPWNVTSASIRLYHNTRAKGPHKSALSKLPQAIAEDDYEIQWLDGVSLADIFELPLGWPGV